MTAARRWGVLAATALIARTAAGQSTAPSTRAAAWDTVVAVVGRTWVDRPFIESRWFPEASRRRTDALAAPNDEAFRAALYELLGLVPASHFYVIPASAFDESTSGAARGTTGLTLRFATRGNTPTVLVSRVDPGSPAAQRGIRAGAEVLAIDDIDIASRLRDADTIRADAQRHRRRSVLLQRVNAAVAPAVGDSVVLRLQLPGSATPRSIAVVSVTDTTPTASFGNLPPLSTRVRASRAELSGGRAAGVIAFDVWLPAIIPQLDRAFVDTKGCDGLVLDLRGNLGGVVGMVMGIGGHLIDTTAVLATLTSRDAVFKLAANPRRVLAEGTRTTPYAGPVALLVDLTTASTSEIFAGALRDLGRARVFGERTAGQALPALTARLATGDVLVHATADLTGPAGQRVDGVGVRPDVAIELSAEALAAGRDPVLDAALAWLSSLSTTRAPSGAACLP
ncbi:MAG: S41 family peptidase [Gemmatimonadaceae bacterium]|nr:S41 family peptidase [Gemmatimonadaceae bacterium]